MYSYVTGTPSKRTLLGFDQINKLENPDTSDKSGSGAGGAGGGGGGGAGAGDMFETVKVSKGASDFAKKVKEAWKKGDFTEIGRIVGEKINKGLRSIDWKKIKATAFKIGKSLATFLNGSIETIDWRLVGKTIAEGLNTVVKLAEGFTKNLHWRSIGKAAADLLKGGFGNIDVGAIARTISNVLKGLPDMVSGFLQNISV